MLLRPALRATSQRCNIHTLGLPVSQRTFTTTTPSLFYTATAARQAPHPFHHRSSPRSSPLTTTSALPKTRTNTNFPILFLAAGSFGAFLASRPITYNDTAEFSSSAYSHGRDAKVPLSKDGGRSINPKAIRQISLGSLMGLGLGVVVSAFSKMLVLVAGLGIVVWQLAARRGYNFIPVDKMQKYVKRVNLRAAINDNAALKISFGLMFALTAFGEF